MNLFRQRGFSLLEAMVAITILSSVSFAVFSWINQSARMLMRSDSVMVQERLVADLLTELEAIDLSSTPEGEMRRDDMRLIWKAQPIDSRQGRTKAGDVGFYDHKLNEVSVTVFRSDLEIEGFKIYVVSSVLARQPSLNLRL